MTGSHVFHGGGKRFAWSCAQAWLNSRPLSRVTIKLASTRTLAAITRHFEIMLLASTQVRRQSLHRADEIGDGSVRRRHLPLDRPAAHEALAHHIGFRKLPFPRFRVELS